MRLELMVRVDSWQFTGVACVEVPEPFIEHFQPLRVSDDALLAALERGAVVNSDTHKRSVKLREDAAKILADHLAHLIVKEMEAQDTVNGYKVVKP